MPGSTNPDTQELVHTGAGDRLGLSGLCLDHPELSLRWERVESDPEKDWEVPQHLTTVPYPPPRERKENLACFLSSQEPPPLSAAEQAQLSEYAVPMAGPQRIFQLLRPHKPTRFISELEDREAARVHRPGLTPIAGRERGKRPRRSSEF